MFEDAGSRDVLIKKGGGYIGMTEKEIDLLDLALEILSHWRGMILWTLIGGIVLTALSFFKLPNTDAGTQAGQSGELSVSALKDKMTQAELAKADHVLVNEYACRQWQSHIENSVFMKIDAAQVYRADLVYAVDTDREKVDLTKLYEDLLSTSPMYAFVVSETDDITAFDAREMISVAASSGSVQGQADPSFCIRITAGTREECWVMMEAVQNYIEKVYQNVIQNYGISHDITLLQDHINATSSTDLLQKQIDIRARVDALQSETADMIENFSQEQMQYYQKMSENGGDVADDAPDPPDRVRYAVLGMVLGIAVFIFPITAKYILEGKLRYSDDCEVLFQIPILGYISSGQEAKGAFAKIDNGLYRLRNKKRCAIPIKNARELSAAAVLMAAQKKGVGCVHIVGCDLTMEAPAKMEKAVRRTLETEGIDAQAVDNILCHADTRLLLRNAEMAVMIEKAGCPLYMIFQELKILKQQKIEISGMIIIE